MPNETNPITPSEEAAEVKTETVVHESTVVMEATEWENYKSRMADLETRLNKMEATITPPTPVPTPEPAPATEPPPAPELTVENTPPPEAPPSKRQQRKRRLLGKAKKKR